MTDLERGKQLYEEALQLKDEPCWSAGYYRDLSGEAVCYELPGDKAYDLMVEAAKLGYPDAQYELGLYYVFRGQNRAVPEDREAAEKRRNENREECIAGFDWIKAAADAGHVKAATTVGHMLFLGNEKSGSIAPDNAAAIPYLEIAAQSDDLAMYHLGRAYEGGYGVPQDDKKAFFWFEKATKAGTTFSPAWTPLGECYLFGKGTTKDIPKAKEAFVGPALMGVPRAQLLLGGICMGGVGFEYADFSTAELVLSKIPASAKEYKSAQELLAALPNSKEQYREWQLQQGNAGHPQQEGGSSQDIPNSTQQTEGDSVTDLDRAVALYNEAINLSEERWCKGVYVPYGNRCFGSFEEPVGQKGRDLMTEAAEMGLPGAQYQLGLFFLFEDKHRREMDVDYEDILDAEQQRLAVFWLTKAAKQGHGEAALVLGDLYMNRVENVELLMAGDARGFQAYQMGAENDDDTMARLGECYFFGKGTEKDYAAAFNCFTKAVKRGDFIVSVVFPWRVLHEWIRYPKEHRQSD